MIGLLWIIAIVLVVLWLLGMFAFHAGGLINILVVVALILLIVWLVQRVKTRH